MDIPPNNQLLSSLVTVVFQIYGGRSMLFPLRKTSCPDNCLLGHTTGLHVLTAFNIVDGYSDIALLGSLTSYASYTNETL